MGIAVRTLGGDILIPSWVNNFDAFRRWIRSTELPEDARIHFINGRVWVETQMERFHSHNKVKSEISAVLRPLVKNEQLGEFASDGMLYTNQECQFTTTPDAIFASNEAFRSDRVWLTGGPHTLDTEWMGTPDLVIEVVSQWSEDKDTEWLMSAYWNAGIPEYWVIDARKDPLRFDILKRKGKEYTPTRRIGGWVKSAVLGRSFRLVAFTNQLGHPDYTLEVR